MGDSNALTTLNTSIPASGAYSGVVEMDRYGIARIYLPSTWTAANLTFQVSETGTAGSFCELVDATGAAVTVTGTAGAAITLDPSVFGLGFRFLIIRSGVVGSVVDQVSTAPILLAVRPI